MSELYARIFVADDTRIQPGTAYWNESYSILEEDFWMLEEEEYYVVKFAEHEYQRAPVIGDYILLRGINWLEADFVYQVYFRVTSILLDKNDEPIKYIIKRETGNVISSHVGEGAVFFNLGRNTDQNYIQLETLS